MGIQAAVSRHILHTDKSGLDVEPPSEGRVRAGGLLVETLAHCLDPSFLQGAPRETQALGVRKRCTATVAMATIHRALTPHSYSVAKLGFKVCALLASRVHALESQGLRMITILKELW